jgi:hypothetical protein
VRVVAGRRTGFARRPVCFSAAFPLPSELLHRLKTSDDGIWFSLSCSLSLWKVTFFFAAVVDLVAAALVLAVALVDVLVVAAVAAALVNVLVLAAVAAARPRVVLFGAGSGSGSDSGAADAADFFGLLRVGFDGSA